jgi:hypothetical protein
MQQQLMPPNKEDEYYQKLLNAATCSKKAEKTKNIMITLGAFVRHEPNGYVARHFNQSYEDEQDETFFLGCFSRQQQPEGNCVTSPATEGEIAFKNFTQIGVPDIIKHYMDYGNEIIFPNHVKYINRCFILSLAHVLNIDVCEFYGNIIKILHNNATPNLIMDQGIQARFQHMNIEKLNTISRSSATPPQERDYAANLANYKAEKKIIMSQGTRGEPDYIDGSLLLKYFKFPDLLPNGLIILLTEQNSFDNNAEINQIGGDQWFGVYIGVPTLQTPIIYNLGETHFVKGSEQVTQEILNSIIAHTNNITPLNDAAPFNYSKLVDEMQDQEPPAAEQAGMESQEISEDTLKKFKDFISSSKIISETEKFYINSNDEELKKAIILFKDKKRGKMQKVLNYLKKQYNTRHGMGSLRVANLGKKKGGSKRRHSRKNATLKGKNYKQYKKFNNKKRTIRRLKL